MRNQFLEHLRTVKVNLTNPQNRIFLSNIAWLSADKLIRLVVGVVVGAWVARYLGPEEYGLLSYALIFCSFFATISTLGFDGIIIRELSTNSIRSNQVLGTAFYLRASIGAILFFISLLIIYLVESNPVLIAITSIIAFGMVFQSADVIDLWFQSKSQSKKTITSRGVAYLIASALKILIIFKAFTLIYFAIVSLLEVLISSVILFISYKKTVKKIQWVFDKETAASLLKEAWPYILSNISILIYMRIDQIMIRELAGNSELGMYSAAVQLSSVFNTVPMILAVAVGPLIARLSISDKLGYKNLLLNLFGFIWWTMLPLGAIFFLFSKEIIDVVYGSEYSDASQILGVHIFTNIPIGLGVIQSLWIVNSKRSSLSLIKTIIGAACNVGLNFLLIPTYGALGAACASLIAQSVSAVLCNIILAPEIFKLQLRGIFFIKNRA